MLQRLRATAGGALCLLALTAAPGAAASPSDPPAQTQAPAPAPPVAGIYRGASIATRFDVSPPLRSIRPRPIHEEEGPEQEDRPTGLQGPPGPQSIDPLVQSRIGPGLIPAPTVSFDGPTNLAGVSPPDPVGDVGPNHYVAMSNLFFAIYDKTGALVMGPVANNTLWSGFGGPCQTENSGDPVVLYDQLADRWILTQFTSAGPNFFNCVAISTSGDPTGTYFRYAFSTGTNFPDYPKYGIWSDAYYISTREFLNTGPFAGVGAYALNRAQMIAGNPAAQVVSFLVPPGGTPYNIGDGLLPADLDGTTTPPGGSPEYYMGSMDDGGGYGAPADALTLWKFHVDFAAPGSSSFVLASTIPVAPFDSIFPCTPATSRNCIPQPGTSQKIDILSYRQRLLHRLAYRNFGTHESLVSNQSVEASAGIAGIRWYELRDPNGAPTIFQQGTYAPGTSDGIHRWMGSMAMSGAGDIALGYSASNTATFPSVWYTGRLAADPPGTMPQGEGTFKNGTGSQTSTGARWGDYSSVNVDPLDDCSFWFVSEYLATTSTAGWRLRIGRFKFAGCSGGPTGTLQGQVTACGSGLPIAGATVTAGVDSGTTDAAGNYSFTLPPGDYTAAVSAAGYVGGGGPVTITDGGTTVLDVCLAGVPLIVSGGATLGAESCPNGRIDPGETVTVSFCVINTGGADTTNLSGDLGEIGGVADAPDPVVFGAVVGGGPAVCRDVTFTMSDAFACGLDALPTLELEDGDTEYPAVAYAFTTGNFIPSLTENFDGVVAPALPAGWSSPSTDKFVTTVTTPDSAPNAAFSADPAVASDRRLVSPAVALVASPGQLRFRNLYSLDASAGDPTLGFDGGVLEIAIGAGGFQDILAAGGSFSTGGYNRTISNGNGSPLAGRMAWSGNSGGYIDTLVNLPLSAAGQSVVLRWRMASDSANGGAGWWVDGVQFLRAQCCSPIAEGLDVDPAVGVAAPLAAGNGVWEPGETVLVAPAYINTDAVPLPLTGAAANLTGPSGAAYAIVDAAAAYGTIAPNAQADCLGTGDCYSISVDNPVARPAPHWDASLVENLSNGHSETWTLHVGASFGDVPDSHIFYGFVETIFHQGVTGGCGPALYCPGNPALRKQMAVFLLKARYGSAYTPPPAAGIFADVPAADPFAPWIEDLYNRGITGGCSMAPLSYCPDSTVLRQQMSVFLLKTLEGADYTPPACSPVFTDVPCPSTFAAWIEELADRGITGGCGGGKFCPADPNTRGQMAVFLTKTFGLRIYGP